MRNLYVHFDGSMYTLKWLKALFWAKAEFRDRGVQVRWWGSPLALASKRCSRNLDASGAGDADALLLAHHHSHQWGLGGMAPGPLVEALQALQQRYNIGQLIWLDTADSTGTTRFEVLDGVDAYWKKQLLVASGAYESSIWAGRPHAQYYHDLYQVQSDDYAERTYLPLPAESAHKLRVSWNVGAGDLFATSKFAAVLLPGLYSRQHAGRGSSARTLDIHFRGSEWPGASGWQRSKAIEVVGQLTDVSHPPSFDAVPRDVYWQELWRSRVVLSPFGWGEICGRDFEAFVAGAALLKPDMSHLATFPNWFVPDETYVPLRWDFSDFGAKVASIQAREPIWDNVAATGQLRFRKFLATDGRQQLVDHILTNLGWS